MFNIVVCTALSVTNFGINGKSPFYMIRISDSEINDSIAANNGTKLLVSLLMIVWLPFMYFIFNLTRYLQSIKRIVH